NDTATTYIYTLSLHDALPISATTGRDRLEILKDTDLSISQVYENISLYDLAELVLRDAGLSRYEYVIDRSLRDITIRYGWFDRRSEEHTSELQSRENLVCRLL